MAKQRTQRTPARSSKTGSSGSYEVAGKLSDGVTILTPKSKPKHFTLKQIKSTIQELRKNSKTGRLMEVQAQRG
ncbi:hypothetical protein SAMN05519103_00824 [Rhizobiales bacterium GAS113]|jgi:hypothetical protein|nr:hypothetical protein SAMN05519103_00824 [Rhizobiales bacterium GAS113]